MFAAHHLGGPFLWFFLCFFPPPCVLQCSNYGQLLCLHGTRNTEGLRWAFQHVVYLGSGKTWKTLPNSTVYIRKRYETVFLNYVFGKFGIYGSALPIWLPLGLVRSYEWTKEIAWLDVCHLRSAEGCAETQAAHEDFSSFTDLFLELARATVRLYFLCSAQR